MENYITTIEKEGKEYSIGGNYCFINLDNITTIGDIMDQIPHCIEGVKYPIFWLIPSESTVFIGSFSYTITGEESAFYEAKVEIFEFNAVDSSDLSTVIRGGAYSLQNLMALELWSQARYPIRMIPSTDGLDSSKTYKLSWRSGHLQ